MSIEDNLNVEGDKNYTTGETAKICRVSHKTVLNWFDSGRLRGFQIPGSKHRRIPGKYLAEFIKEYGIVTKEGVYTTGETAKILSISQQTIIRHFDVGGFENGYRIPNSRFRRIPHSSLVKFAEKYGLKQQLEDYFGCSAQDL